MVPLVDSSQLEVAARSSGSVSQPLLQPVSIIVPAYNEHKGIALTLSKLQESLQANEIEFEVIVVDDGSTDGTAEVLAKIPSIRVVRHPYNSGYGAALKTGIRHARYDLIVITDADGTYPNDRIADLVLLANEADMVVGARVGSGAQQAKTRKFAKWFLRHFAEWMVRQPIPDINSGMRVFRKDVVERFLRILPDTFSFTTTITLAMLTNRYHVHYEPIEYHARVGKSKIKPIHDTLRFLQLILRTGMYFAPLRVFLPVAGIFFLGFLVTLFQDVFVRHDLTERTLILLVTATQLAMFALLADMLDKRSS